MSLLQGVLKSNTADAFSRSALSPPGSTTELRDDSDDELINVMSMPGTPARSRAPSRPSSRPQSPTRRGVARLTPASTTPPTDPLKVLPTAVNQMIFRHLSIQDLARCAKVSRKWYKSQTINYIWFQHYRKENFHDDDLPPGKWTRRESKQNWRNTYHQSIVNRSPPSSPPPARFRASGASSPISSGYQTPKEYNEEKWKQEEMAATRPNKVEMREMYKEMGGRKSRNKAKLGSAGGIRDKTGWDEPAEDMW